MVAVIAGIAVLIVALGILFGVPRVVGGGGGGGTPQWPDLLAGGERIAQAWIERSRLLDLGLGIVTVVILAAALSVYQDPGMAPMGGRLVAYVLGIVGFAGTFTTAYLGVRRSGLSSAEAAFIGGSLVGIVMLLLITYLLIA